MADTPVAVTDATFDAEVLQADIPVLIDFWAEWCGPCKMIKPVVEAAAAEYAGKIKVMTLDIDENPETPAKYGVRGIPTLILFHNGNVEGTKIGSITQTQLNEFIDGHL